MCSCVSVMRWMSRKRGAISARVPGSVVGGRSPISSTSRPLSSRASRKAACSILLQFDVPAQRQPFIELAMMDQKHAAVSHHKNGHCEIDLLMNMRHAVRFYKEPRKEGEKST